MIHLDNSFISMVSLDPDLSKAFYKYINKTKKDVLLNNLLLFETMNSSNEYHVKNRLEFLKNIPRKRNLNFIPIGIFDIEIFERYLNAELPSKADIKNIHSTQLDRKNWNAYIGAIQSIFPTLQEKMAQHVHAWLASKNIAVKSEGSKIVRVKYYMNPAIAHGHVSGEYSLRYKENLFKRIKAGKYLEGLENYGTAFIKRVDSMSIGDFQKKVHRNINVFGLDRKNIHEMEMNDYLDLDFYLSYLIDLANKRVNPNHHARFLKKMAEYSLETFPGFHLQWKVHRHIQASDNPAKHGDPMDMFYLHLAPYVDTFILDANMKENVRQVSRKWKIQLDMDSLITTSEAMFALKTTGSIC